MRLVCVVAAALMLSSCSWVQHQIAPAPVAPAAPAAKPDTPRPHHPRPAPPPAPVAAPAVAAPAPPAPPPPPDYSGRCHALAQNRADDAKQLGATAADQAKMQSDTYRDCMAQSVK